MSILIQIIVGQLDFLEGDVVLHPLCPGGGGLRVNVEPAGHLWLRLPRHLPLGASPFVAGVVGEAKVQKNHILLPRIQAGDRGF